MWYNGGMDIGHWITLVAVIVALGIGVSSLIQTQRLQKRERIERLLNEIVEWAIDVTKWRPKEIYKDMIDLSDELRLRKLIYSHIVGIMESFIEMRGRNQYISNISAMFSKDLEEAVGNLIDTLEIKIELLSEWKSTIANAISKGVKEDDEHYFKKAEEQEYQIERLALKVIEEATKVKTQNIGMKEENMPKEGEVTGSNEPAIKAIEAHLIRQDNEMKRGKWFALGAIGFAVALVAVSLWIGTGDLSLCGLFYNERGFLFGVGFLVMIISWVKQRKIKD